VTLNDGVDSDAPRRPLFLAGCEQGGVGTMTDRERVLAVLHYEPVDRIPVVHFGFLADTLNKWCAEGHLTEAEARGYRDGNEWDLAVSRKLGFDFHTLFPPNSALFPGFESEVVREFPDGSRHVMTGQGIVVLDVPGAGSIQPDVDHLLKDRKAWEELYLPKLQFCTQRIDAAPVRVGDRLVPFGQGGRDYLLGDERDYLLGLRCGSLYGNIRTWLTLEGACYLMVDDKDLFTEIIDTNAELVYACTRAALESGVTFDYAHFWEDICFKNGPLIAPSMFAEKVGHHYRRITELVNSYGIDIVSLDCDGWIDALIPTWFENGVNTMFPIEVGTWGASIAPWRETYGNGLRGVGGMDKRVFARDRAAVDAEIERLRALVDLGGYLPCPDHRIADDAEWDNVRYYCERMHEEST
jgi:uroporphyrinogen decarboxylase